MRFLIAIAVLLITAVAVQAQTPQQSGPLGVAPSAQEIELGRKLFFDPRLSEDGTVSCSTCHDPRQGWSDGLPVAVGIRGQAGTRNSPTVINASYSPLMFWDGRAIDTTSQALLPLANPIEMGRQTDQDVVRRLRLIPGYLVLFAEVYGIDPIQGSPVTGVNLGRAIAAFESTVVSFDAPIDRYLEGDKDALTPDAKVGLNIFKAAKCAQCHSYPLMTDNLFHNNGMEFAGKLRITDQGRAGVLPRGSVRANHVRAFKTPTLREIARTAPYNHAGNFATLERVIAHYNAGGGNYQGLKDRFTDPRIRPLGLTAEQQKYLVVFLREAFASSSYPLIEEPVLP